MTAPEAQAPGKVVQGKVVKVWDPLVRVLHWGLATCVITAFFTRHGPEIVHNTAGYIALGIALVRIVWGFAGGEFARFTNFIASPRATINYTLALLRGREAHYLGHNPLGAWMIVALLVSVLVTTVSGILLDTDRFWGDETLEDIHSFAGKLFVPLVILHVGGVIFTSFRQKENLVTAMITGRKAKPDK